MTKIDPRITDRVATCVGTLLALTPPTTKVFITDTVCSSTLVILAPGDVSRTSRYGTTPCNRDVVVRYPRDNRTILIGIIVFPPTIGNSGSQDILKNGNPHPQASARMPKWSTLQLTEIWPMRGILHPFSENYWVENSDSLVADIYARCQVDFTSNSVGTKAPDLVHLGILAVDALG